MKIKNLPKITNVDRIRVYRNNELIAEQWIGGCSLLWYFQEVPQLKAFLECEIEEMEMNISGCMDDCITCEITLK